MRVVIRYDLGDGPQDAQIGPKALVGWELETKQRMSDLANGFGIGDMVTMLYQQLKAEGKAPATRAELLNALVDIGPENTPEDPTQQLDAEASPDPSLSFP